MAPPDETPLPLPGSGRTWERWTALAAITADDVARGRLAEADADADAICAELGHGGPPAGATCGVWAAGPLTDLQAVPHGGGGWRLQGRRSWCSGAETISHALVTADSPEGDLLLLVALDQPGVRPVPGTWTAVAMAAAASPDVTFDAVDLGPEAVVGPPGSYLHRPGFWHGGAGVAACWWGGAVGVATGLRAAVAKRSDPHRLAHLGAVDATLWGTEQILRAAARAIDDDPCDRGGGAHLLAQRTRHLVEQACVQVLERTNRAVGPGLLCHDQAHARRVADLGLYVRQQHGEPDLADIGGLVL